MMSNLPDSAKFVIVFIVSVDEEDVKFKNCNSYYTELLRARLTVVRAPTIAHYFRKDEPHLLDVSFDSSFFDFDFS